MKDYLLKILKEGENQRTLSKHKVNQELPLWAVNKKIMNPITYGNRQKNTHVGTDDPLARYTQLRSDLLMGRA